MYQEQKVINIIKTGDEDFFVMSIAILFQVEQFPQ